MIVDNMSNTNLYEMKNNSKAFLYVFSDGSPLYCTPINPERGSYVKIRLRVDKYTVSDIKLLFGELVYEMSCEEIKGDYCFYSAKVLVESKRTYYYFQFQEDQRVYYYTRKGISYEPAQDYLFEVIAGYSIPEWAMGTHMYQIFTDRFCNGNTDNDVVDDEYNYLGKGVKRKKDWYSTPDSFDVANFYGGDLQGVCDKLDYLQSLGVETIYFNPLFVSPSNHKYDTQDYDHIDPHFTVIKSEVRREQEAEPVNYESRVTDKENLKASDEFFAKCVAEIHSRGMRLILDGVFNHCGSYNKWMNREGIYKHPLYEQGAFESKDSIYRSFFYFNSDDTYDCWWNHTTLPKLRYEKDGKLWNEILRIASKWVSAPYYADGWRLDVAADLGTDEETNRQFWRSFRKTVKKANPDAVIIAEHYGNASQWLDGNMWDSIMNYDAFMEPVSWFFTGMEKHSDYYNREVKNNVAFFWNSISEASFKLPYIAVMSAMNELSNHDHSRFLTRTNSVSGRVDSLGAETAEIGVNHAIMREAVLLQFTWPGSPATYYGDEAALCGFTDPDNRRTYPWGREDETMLSFHKDIGEIYREYSILKQASITRLACDSDSILSYARFTDDEQMIILINNTEAEISCHVLVLQAGISEHAVLKRLICTYESGYNRLPADYVVENGKFEIIISAHSGVALYHKGDEDEKED